MKSVYLIMPIALMVLARTATATSVADPFSSDPSAVDHEPFMWDLVLGKPTGASAWVVTGGALEYHTRNARHSEARVDMFTAGLQIRDGVSWSVETAFRHLSGVAPDPNYEAVLYARWNSETPGAVRIFSLCYDSIKKNLVVANGNRIETPIAADLTGAFHKLRITFDNGNAAVYLDGKLKGGPYPIGSLPMEWGPERFVLGPIVGDQQPHTLRCAWNYFAATDEGAFPPGDAGWIPDRVKGPTWLPSVIPGESVDPSQAFDHPPYPGIKLLHRTAGRDRFDRSLPQEYVLWKAFNANKATQQAVPIYRYPDASEPTMQNFYRDSYPVKLDDRRSVAMLNVTRGEGDTAHGLSDYKLWYCISTNGGKTYDEERPLVQRGNQYSPQHPNQYVWIGKNSFIYATLGPRFMKMSNGEIFLPCYYLPLDDNGKLYSPNGLASYANVFGLIGAWNNEKNDVDWDVTKPIALRPEQSTGGLSESGVIELRDRPGHVLMVIRAGNEGDNTGKVPCWKWKTLSTDYGKTWSELTPFTFGDGKSFWSPTSQAMFIRSSRTGKAYWIGNISRRIRPVAGSPRYPLVIAELDEEKLDLRRETVTVIDDRMPGDSADMQLSNFDFIEDSATGHILITLERSQGRSSWGSPPNGPGVSGQQTYEIHVE
ncbi:MAG: exo-alpha-sialidase [Pirellulales bacterium]|nr:exo-alpha-sialidase [Pirellulales bacterium]